MGEGKSGTRKCSKILWPAVITAWLSSNNEQHGVFIDSPRRFRGAVFLLSECPAACRGLWRRGRRGSALGDGRHSGRFLRLPRLVLTETQRTVLIRHVGLWSGNVASRLLKPRNAAPAGRSFLIVWRFKKTLDTVVEGERDSIRGSELQKREVVLQHQTGETVCWLKVNMPFQWTHRDHGIQAHLYDIWTFLYFVVRWRPSLHDCTLFFSSSCYTQKSVIPLFPETCAL